MQNRKLCVKVGNSLSYYFLQTSGIVQSTCLGPIYFTVYINDLPCGIKFSKCKLFADDVKISYDFFACDLTDAFQDDLNSIESWSLAWQLTRPIFVVKTVLFHLGYHNPKNIYFISGAAVQSKECMKDLGVIVSNDFSWHTHCFEIVKKASYVANAILHSFLCDDVSIYMQTFNIYIRPILEYNGFIWNLILFYNVDLIEKVKKNCTHRVFEKCNLPSMTYDCRLKYLKSHSLEQR